MEVPEHCGQEPLEACNFRKPDPRENNPKEPRLHPGLQLLVEILGKHSCIRVLRAAAERMIQAA